MTDKPDAGEAARPTLAENLRATTELMANHCRVDQGLWNNHSNYCLSAAKRIEELEKALGEMAEDLEYAGHGCGEAGCDQCDALKKIRAALKEPTDGKGE